MQETLTIEQHSQSALRLLENAEREFANGDIDQASEKFWLAATGVTAAVVEQLGWICKDNREMKKSIETLASQSDNERLASQYGAIEIFYMRVRYGLAEDFQLDSCRPIAHEFVKNMLVLLQDNELLAKMRKHANDGKQTVPMSD